MKSKANNPIKTMTDKAIETGNRNIVVLSYQDDKVYKIFTRVDKLELFPSFGVVGVTLLNDLITDVTAYIKEIKTRKRFGNAPVLEWITFYTLFSKENSEQIITNFFQERLPILNDIKVINEIEFLLKLSPFFFLKDNSDADFNLLTPSIKHLNFSVEFLYACSGNAINYDDTIRYFNNKDLNSESRSSSLCFQYKIVFHEAEASEEIIKLTVTNLQMLQQSIQSLLKQNKSEILTFPPYVVIEKMDIDKINKDFFELIKDEKVNLAGSKHEVMLHLARLTKIENLDYWLNKPINKKYLDNYYYDILSTRYDFKKPEGL